MDARLRAGVDVMLRVGGSFERALAQAAIECEDGHEFMRCLVAAHKVASDANAATLETFFHSPWRVILNWSAEQRLDSLARGSFAILFGRHIAMAEAAA